MYCVWRDEEATEQRMLSTHDIDWLIFDWFNQLHIVLLLLQMWCLSLVVNKHQPHHIQPAEERFVSFTSTPCCVPLRRKDFLWDIQTRCDWTRHPSNFCSPPARPAAPTSMSAEMKPPPYNIIKHYHSAYVSTAELESHVLTSCAMVANESKGHVWCLLMYQIQSCSEGAHRRKPCT